MAASTYNWPYLAYFCFWWFSHEVMLTLFQYVLDSFLIRALNKTLINKKVTMQWCSSLRKHWKDNTKCPIWHELNPKHKVAVKEETLVLLETPQMWCHKTGVPAALGNSLLRCLQWRTWCNVWLTGLLSKMIGGSEISRSSSPREEFWSVFTKFGMLNFVWQLSSSSTLPVLWGTSWKWMFLSRAGALRHCFALSKFSTSLM